MLSDLFYRFRALFHRKAVETELVEELRYHLDREAEKYRQVGDPAEEAMRRARLALGGPEQVRQQCREARGIRLLEDVFHDLHFGMRMLVKSPGFTAVALLTLALGVGANTAVFSLINGLLLRPLPVPHAEQLVVVRYDRSDLNNPNYAFSAPIFRALEHRHEAFRDVAAYAASTLQVRGSSGNVEVPGALVSGQFFGALETQPLLGRYLTPADDRAGGGPSGFGVVISEGTTSNYMQPLRMIAVCK